MLIRSYFLHYRLIREALPPLQWQSRTAFSY